MLKKTLMPVFIILLCISFILTGCTQNAKSQKGSGSNSKKVKIGVSMADLSNPYFVQVLSGITDTAKNKNVELIVDDPKSNSLKQAESMKSFISSKCDAIIMCALDPKLIDPLTKIARENGIKVLAQSTRLENANIYVSAKEWDMGHTLGLEAGKFIKEKLGGSAKVALLDFPSIPQLIIRTKGIKDGIKEIAPNSVFIDQKPAGTPDEGKKAVKEIFKAHPDVKVICGINDGGALGALSIVDAEGKNTDNFFIGGIDATQEALVKIHDDTVYRATVDIEPYNTGKIDLEFALLLVKGENTPETYTVKSTVVNKSNINNYYKRDNT